MSSYQDKSRLENSEVSEVDNSTTSNKTKVPKKPKTLKNHGFNVPKRDCHYCVKGCIYIYKMIKEVNGELLERLDVREAYNNFVECCLKYGDIIYSHIPRKSATYHHKLRPFLGYEESTKTFCLPFGFRIPTLNNQIVNEENKKKKEEAEKDILEKYTVLYELIKRDIIPYMELKSWEVICKEETEQCNAQIRVLNEHIKNCEDVISRHHRFISKNQECIANLAQRALDAQKPPVLTSFD
jgi:hypothetical protein